MCEIRQSFLFRKKVLDSDYTLKTLILNNKRVTIEPRHIIKEERPEFDAEYLEDEMFNEDEEAIIKEDDDEEILGEVADDHEEDEELDDYTIDYEELEDPNDYQEPVDYDGTMSDGDEEIITVENVLTIEDQTDQLLSHKNSDSHCSPRKADSNDQKLKNIENVSLDTNFEGSNESIKKCFPCSLCEKGYLMKHLLKRHIRTKHPTEEQANDLTCDFCSKTLLTKSALDSHTRLHTGDRPFKCHKCEKRFVSKSSLLNHMPSHNPIGDPLPCDICDKVFSRAVNLYKHRRIHTVTKKHECNFCGKLFLSKQTCRVGSHFFFIFFLVFF